MHSSDNHDNAIDELAADVDTAKSILDAEDGPFNRRVYIRALFAYLEGSSFFMRRNAEELLKKRREFGKLVNPETEFLLRDVIPSIASEGRVVCKKHKVPFADHFAFTFRTFIEALEIQKDPFCETGWADLKKALIVRDRLTHPKLQSDVEISDQDLFYCQSGIAWLGRIYSETLNKRNWGFGRS